MSAQTAPAPRVTPSSLGALKGQRPVVMITAYDYHSARLVESAGVDSVLVGDSLGMTMLGFDSTLPVTMDDMVRHTAAVSRACERALVIADMPFMSYQADIAEGMRNAARLMVEGGAGAVKVEGAGTGTLTLVRALVEAGIPVMGHVGLTPQSVHVLGGYRTQAREAESAAKLMADCRALEHAGAFGVVLECIPVELAERVSAMLSIITIGIGAGAGCDGQVQVFHDLLGLGDFKPRHAATYVDAGALIREGVAAYAADVRARAFPTEAQSTHAESAIVSRAEEIFSTRGA